MLSIRLQKLKLEEYGYRWFCWLSSVFVYYVSNFVCLTKLVKISFIKKNSLSFLEESKQNVRCTWTTWFARLTKMNSTHCKQQGMLCCYRKHSTINNAFSVLWTVYRLSKISNCTQSNFSLSKKPSTAIFGLRRMLRLKIGTSRVC